VLPDSNQRAHALFLDIRTKKPGFDLKENEFYDGIEGYTFLVKNITHASDSLYDVTLFQEPTSTRDKAIIKAKKGHLQSNKDETLTLYLYKGSIQRYFTRIDNGRRTQIVEKTGFNRHRITFDLSEMAFSRSSPNDHARNDRTMDIKAMMAVVDSLHDDIQKEKKNIAAANTFQISSSTFEDNRSKVKNILPDSLKGKPLPSRYTLLKESSDRASQQKLYDNTLNELRNYRSSLESLLVNTNWRINRIAKYWVEIHKKISLPLACIIFVLVGAPIGMYSKKGNLGYAALIGTVFLTFFWISIIQGEKLADRLYISPFTGMWFANILLAVIGGLMVINLCTPFRISNLWKKRD